MSIEPHFESSTPKGTHNRVLSHPNAPGTLYPGGPPPLRVITKRLIADQVGDPKKIGARFRLDAKRQQDDA
jgi:hypothetical protein